jgi:sulfur carrier protein
MGSYHIGGFPVFVSGNAGNTAKRRRMVKINGKNEDACGKSIAQYLSEADYDPRVIAVEYNEEIISKEQYERIILKEGDVLEIVRFMGGGC